MISSAFKHKFNEVVYTSVRVSIKLSPIINMSWRPVNVAHIHYNILGCMYASLQIGEYILCAPII